MSFQKAISFSSKCDRDTQRIHSPQRSRACVKSSQPKGMNEQAFSRADLLVTLAMASVLSLMQIAALANVKSKGREVPCFRNLGRLTQAWQMYAQDHQGKLVGNLDGQNAQSVALSNVTWILGWMDFQGGGFPFGPTTNTALFSQYSPLATYVNREGTITKCPADTSTINLNGKLYPRVRSISMNGYMGQRSGPYTAGFRQFKTLEEITKPTPAQAFVFIDEREESINDPWFAFDMTGSDPLNPNLYTLVDYPAMWHERGANLSFADGHVETWRWRDPRTMPPPQPGQLMRLGNSSPNNPDVTRLQASASSKLQ
jgi:prepilin-type processing-associated H-X9-DG protein